MTLKLRSANLSGYPGFMPVGEESAALLEHITAGLSGIYAKKLPFVRLIAEAHGWEVELDSMEISPS
jgi:hypothetical protein